MKWSSFRFKCWMSPGVHYRLLSRARGDHRWILDARYRKGLEDYVFRPEHEKGLLQGLQDDDPSVVLLSAKLFAGHCPDKRLLCEALLRVTECETPFIRRTALNYLAANQIPKEQAGSLVALIPLCFAGTPGDAAALLAALSAVEGEHDKISGSVADAWPTLYFFLLHRTTPYDFQALLKAAWKIAGKASETESSSFLKKEALRLLGPKVLFDN